MRSESPAFHAAGADLGTLQETRSDPIGANSATPLWARREVRPSTSSDYEQHLRKIHTVPQGHPIVGQALRCWSTGDVWVSLAKQVRCARFTYYSLGKRPLLRRAGRRREFGQRL